MDDEFAKALDSLHNSIDQAVDHVALPGPVRDSWTLPERVDPPKVSASPTTFLIQVFFVLFAIAALQYVQMYVQKKPQVIQVVAAESIAHEEKNLLQEDALSQAELEQLLKVKTAIVEPDPIAPPIVYQEPKHQEPKQVKHRPDHSFPIEEAPWVEAEEA